MSLSSAHRTHGATLTMRIGDDTATGAVGESGFLMVLESNTSTLVPIPWDGELSIGRTAECAVRVRSPAVSRTHARVSARAGEIFVADLGSHNGTYVNGEAVSEPRQLAPGDSITLCDVTVVFCGRRRVGAARRLHPDVSFLRERLDEELDRSSRWKRSLALLVLEGPTPWETERVAQAVSGLLRLCDVAALDGARRLVVLQPECDDVDASQCAQRIVDALFALGGAVKAGYAVHPSDGLDADALWEGAHSAAAAATPGKTLAAGAAVSTLLIGDRNLIIADPTMSHLYTLIRRLAPSELTVLICGETGTGKELAAQALHALSPRSKERMLSLNCAALTENLAESELFGHERGAFSGALASKPGLLEAAQGGTVFLDEVAELSPSVQAKLLRALESRKFLRVGDVRERQFTARVVAATNRDLEQEVAAGRFRQDLYFRLSTAVLHLPPLRTRPRELPLLARAFLAETRARLGQPPLILAPAALDALLRYRWPGNVRELKNAMDYAAAVVTEDLLTPQHLPQAIRAATTEQAASSTSTDGKTLSQMARALLHMPLDNKLDGIEDALISEALTLASGNKSAAARLLGVHRKIVERRLTRQRTRDGDDPGA